MNSDSRLPVADEARLEPLLTWRGVALARDHDATGFGLRCVRTSRASEPCLPHRRWRCWRSTGEPRRKPPVYS